MGGEAARATTTRLATTIRRAPLAASVGVRHLGRHPAVAAARLLRALPAPLRRTLARTLGRTTTGAGALSLVAVGRTGDALGTVDRLAARGPRGVRTAVTVAVAAHQAAAARAALAHLPVEDPSYGRLTALTEAEAGHLTAAVEAIGSPRDAGGRRLLRSLTAELSLLAPTGRPAVAPLTGPGTESPPADEPLDGGDLRVLHMVTNALPEVQAGYTTRTHGIALAQRALGIDARVAPRLGFPVTAGHLAAAEDVVHEGVPTHRLLPTRVRAGGDPLAADVAASLALVRRVRPDVLHAHSKYLNARVALEVRDRTAVPVVYEVRGFLEETWLSRGGDPTADVYRLARASETEAMLAADAVVTISQGMREAILERGVDPARLHVVPNSVDDRFHAEPADGHEVRTALGIADHEVVLGTLTTLNDYEGVDVLLDAAALLRADGHPVRVLVVGDGPAASGLREHARRVLPDGGALLPGRVPFAEVRGYHAAIDVFCVPRPDLPVTSKVTPIKPLEALASARPVVASDLGPLREIVRPGVWGELAAPGDPAALARAAAGLVGDPDLRLAYGRAGREWVLAERTWERAARTYLALYRALTVPRGT